jgi:hypothetical protein
MHFSIELDLVLIPSIENLSRTYPEEDVDNIPVDIGIARSIMNKVLSSIIKAQAIVYRSTSLNAHVSVVSNLHTFWQLRRQWSTRSMIGIHLS